MDIFGISVWEWMGAATGVACVWLAAKKNILTWPIGIISAVAYLILFYSVRLYSDAVLQLIFVVTQLYGWIQWVQQKRRSSQKIKTVQFKHIAVSLIAVIVAWPLWYYLVIAIKPDADYLLWDSLTTVISLIAIAFQAHRNIYNWLLWIVADLIYLPIYLAKSLHITAGLYTIFLILAVYGWMAWRRELILPVQRKEG